jgi:hypothetical protein
VPVQVYGGCAHPVEFEGRTVRCLDGFCDTWGFGLCDRFSRYTPGGSDCNRAEFFLLRPSDLDSSNGLSDEDLAVIREALEEVLDG